MNDREKQLTLAAATLGSFVTLLDSSVVHVALPAIRDDLGGGLAGQQWVVTAYLLFLGSLILLGGSLGDVYGERRMFMIGISGFGVSSLACALAPTVGVLIASRAVQGAFGALLMPASLAVLVVAFPPGERGRAIGIWTAYSGIAAVVGPLVGGWIVDFSSWRLIFAVNVPFVAGTLLLARAMPRSSSKAAMRRPDVLGACLGAIGLAGATFALARQPEAGWGAPSVLGPALGGFALLIAFIAWERRATDPMLPLSLFGSGNFSWGNVQTVLVYGSLSGMFFVLTLFLQQVSGYSALQAGAVSVPTTVVLFALSRRIGQLSDTIGPRLFMGLGPAICAAGVLWLALAVDDQPRIFVDVLPGIVVFSVGLSIVVSPLTATILAGVSDRDAGIASGVNNAAARIASLLATASVGIAVGGTLDLAGLQVTLGACVVALLLASLIGTLRIENPARSVSAADCAGGQLAGAPAPAAIGGQSP
jgi:EmrB/QacA subfamily drug resistance transporter